MAVLKVKEDGAWKEIQAIKGSDGHTPEKGVDYFTEEDIESLNIPTKVSDLTNDAGYTTNTGTITGVKMNGSTVATSGMANLGTVITEHQDISGKVDKVPGKGLSSNDFTTVYKGAVDSNTAARHGHNNKLVIDGISSSDITNWNNKADASDIPDVSNFITKSVNDLLYYYKKTETFTKQEVNDLISAISTLTLEVVQTLPTQDISTTTIYLVPKTTAETNDVYDEYIYVSNAWEHIGSTQTDLTNYYTKTQVDGKVNVTLDGQTYTTMQDTMDMLVSEFGAALETKQPEITSSNKLSSDLVDDTNNTNKFVTAEEKTTWNNKSNFSGDFDDLTDKPVMTYIDTEINNRVVTQVTRTKTIESTHDNLYYGTYHFIPLDMSPYTSGTASKALKPEDHLPAGRYVVTNSGHIRMGSTNYKLVPGTFIFWDGSELNLIGYNACEYWSYYEGEWEGGYFTTQVDVESMLEEAVISTTIRSGNFDVASKDNGYYLFNYSTSSGNGKRLSINIEGNSTYYYPYNGTILIKNDRYVVMLGRENLIFEYDSENSYYKTPIELKNTPTTAQITAWDAKYDKPSGGIPKTDLASDVQTSLGKADTATQPGDLTDYIKKDGGSSQQTISLTGGTGTTALGLKSMAASSYVSMSGTGGWLGSYGVSSDKKPVFYNGTGYTLAYTSDVPKIFYGTSSTGASTAAKVVTCESFTASDLVAGTRITVLFTNANSFNGQATLNINGTGAKNIYYNGTTTNARYMWVAGETVDFVYNGTQWATINGGLATTSYYGVTKLYTGAGSDSQTLALTPRSLYYLANYSIAPYYSASATYAVGDKVRYTYYLYECNTAIETPEAWTAAHWTQIDTLQEQIDSLKAEIEALRNSL